MSSIESLERYTSTRFAVRASLIALAAFVLAVPFFFRSPSSLLYGFEAYFHLSQGTVSYVLSFFSSLFHADVFFVAKVLPPILGILSLMLFYGILRRLGFRYGIIVIASLLLIISPSFFFLFATLTDFSFLAFILLLVFYLLLCNRDVPALLLFYLVAFFGMFNLALASLLLLFYCSRVKKVRLFLYALPSFLIAFFLPSPSLYSFGSFISDFGGPFGLGAFLVILSFFGLRFFWKEKYAHLYFYLAILSLAIFSFFNLRFLSLLNFFLSLLAALGLEALFERHWRSTVIKSLTILTLAVGLVISCVSYVMFVVNGLPNVSVVEGLYALRDLPQGAVFSHPSRAYWVGFVGKPFVYDDSLFYTRDIGDATAAINRAGISYIWIDRDMKSSVWVEEDQGLLFLLKYSKSFKNVYSNGYVDIWEFVRGAE